MYVVRQVPVDPIDILGEGQHQLNRAKHLRGYLMASMLRELDENSRANSPLLNKLQAIFPEKDCRFKLHNREYNESSDDVAADDRFKDVNIFGYRKNFDNYDNNERGNEIGDSEQPSGNLASVFDALLAPQEFLSDTPLLYSMLLDHMQLAYLIEVLDKAEKCELHKGENANLTALDKIAVYKTHCKLALHLAISYDTRLHGEELFMLGSLILVSLIAVSSSQMFAAVAAFTALYGIGAKLLFQLVSATYSGLVNMPTEKDEAKLQDSEIQNASLPEIFKSTADVELHLIKMRQQNFALLNESQSLGATPATSSQIAAIIGPSVEGVKFISDQLERGKEKVMSFFWTKYKEVDEAFSKQPQYSSFI